MESINYLAVFVAALSTFLLGGIWYSPAMFGKIWNREAGVSEDHHKNGHGAKVFIVSFLLSLIAATVFALLLGHAPELKQALWFGFLVGACFVSTSFGINYLFGKRTMKLLLIDVGYHTVQFLLYGTVLGLWH